jgi:hypothetical protein
MDVRRIKHQPADFPTSSSAWHGIQARDVRPAPDRLVAAHKPAARMVWALVHHLNTQMFDDPVRGREFFEEVMRDNLDLGRPDRIQLLVDRKILANTPSRFSTRVITDGILPSLHVEYKRCHTSAPWAGASIGGCSTWNALLMTAG